MTIRVLLADDQPLVRAGLAVLLGAEPRIQVVAEACDGNHAVELARLLHPDVVLMDVCMPGLDGVAATRVLTSEGFLEPPHQPVKVLMLTTYHVDDAVYLALRAGASGFMLKTAAPHELVAAITAVAAGDAWLDPAVARDLLREFKARPDPRVAPSAEMQHLTAREREVLALVAQGLSNSEIATRLVVAEATVKTHFGHVLTKLGVHDRAQAVVAAYRTGLVHAPTRCP